MRQVLPILSLVALLVLAGCSDEADGGTTTSKEPTTMFGGDDRPVELKVPPTYDGSAAPLVILIHGYGASGQLQNAYLNIAAATQERGMLYAFPDGLKDSEGKGYWNAFPACCDFDNTGVDDAGYLLKLIEDIRAEYNVDSKRIFLVGHSNGGFMSYRMACDHSEIFAGVASLAGSMDPSLCSPSEPVYALQIHGTDDDKVPYVGGQEDGNVSAGAVETAQYWANVANCAVDPVAAEPVDVDRGIAGAETTVERYEKCDAGGAAELWTIASGSHLPAITDDFAAKVLDRLLAHPKP